MRKELTAGLFRVSAILYARNNSNNISIKQIIRKIIEDALFQNKKDEAMPLSSLIQFIIDNYALTLSENEICSILQDVKFTDYFDSYDKEDCLMISLKKKRRIVLEKQAGNKTLHDFIIEFIKLKNFDESKIEVLYNFLYGVFTTNLEGYKQLLKEKNLLKIEDDSYTEDDKVIINQFLDWDNSEKNAAIYNLASYALEYCLLTNQKDATIDINILKNKYLYLDANVLFRAVGVNGEDRRLRTEQFLNQFAKVQQNLCITRETDNEFRNTLEFYTEKIKRTNKPTARVNPKVYVDTIDIDGFFKYYYIWKIGRSEDSVETFKVYLLAKYDELLKRFKIEKDTIKPYDEDKQIEKIKELASAIRSYKEDKSYSAAEIDARNIIWLEHKRNGQNDDLFQVKHFFISSDHYLRRWDFSRNSNNVPIVMLPSQWLSLILRYMERTDNDYKSFVYFLNMKVNHPTLSEEQLLYAIEGISEIATDVTEQSNLIRSFIKEDFNKEMQGLSNEEIQERAKTYAETEYERKIKELETENNDKTTIIENLKQENVKKEKKISAHNKQIKQAAKDSEELKGRIKKIEDELERRKDYYDIKEENDKYKLIRWKTPRLWLIGITLFVWLAFLLFCFVAIDWEYNPSTKVLKWISNWDVDRKEIAKHIIFWGYILIGLCLFCSFTNILFLKTEDDKKNWYKSIIRVIKKRLRI